jgi:DNA polymerase-3 subunit gamma/tau
VDDEYVTNLMGGMDRQLLFDLSAAVFARDISRILALIDAIFNSGQDLKRFYTELLMHFRHLMLVKMNARPELLVDLCATEIETLTRQAEGVSIAHIDQVFSLLFNAETSVRHASQPRLAIELAFFKIHQIIPALPIDLLIERLDSLLKGPNLKPPAGIVEAQSTYGDLKAPAPVSDPDGHTRPGDQETTVDPVEDEPSADSDALRPAGDADWGRLVAIIAQTKPSIAAALSRSQLVSVSEQAFQVAVHDSDYTMNLVKKNLAMIDAVCRDHAGRGIQVTFSSDDAGVKHAAAGKQQVNDIKQQLLNHPLVADAVDIFKGKIEEIKIN